jgi:hypothetical protein
MHKGESYSDTCWFYTNSTNHSSSWTGANVFRRYINSSVSKIKMRDSDWSNVSNGDIIQLLDNGSAFHSMIISVVEYNSWGRSELLVCAHTYNRRHVALSDYYPGYDKAYYHIVGNK